jgi:hypothetical protein
MWDKLRAQQASCLLNKPSAWHVLMELHCLINLKLFFPPQLSLSAAISFFSVFYTYFDPIPLTCTKQRLDISGNPGSDAIRGQSSNRFVSKMVFFIFSLFRHLGDVPTPFEKSDSVHHTPEGTLLLPCLSVSLFVVGNSLFLPSLPVRKVVACNYYTLYEMG